MLVRTTGSNSPHQSPASIVKNSENKDPNEGKNDQLIQKHLSSQINGGTITGNYKIRFLAHVKEKGNKPRPVLGAIVEQENVPPTHVNTQPVQVSIAPAPANVPQDQKTGQASLAKEADIDYSKSPFLAGPRHEFYNLIITQLQPLNEHLNAIKIVRQALYDLYSKPTKSLDVIELWRVVRSNELITSYEKYCVQEVISNYLSLLFTIPQEADSE